MMTGEIFIVGAVRGLVSEGERVFSTIQSLRPNIIAVSVSKEGLAAMKKAAVPETACAEAANIEEEIYIDGLSEFGEVIKPPPCFSMAVKAAKHLSIQTEPLDMDDEHYTAAYCKYISTLDMMRQGRSGKFFSNHTFLAETPEQFVIEWDGLVNRLKGYRELEMAREEWLAKGICRLAKKHGKIVAVIELERQSGVIGYLKTLGCDCAIL